MNARKLLTQTSTMVVFGILFPQNQFTSHDPSKAESHRLPGVRIDGGEAAALTDENARGLAELDEPDVV